ncbi:MAG: ABC transporter permease [Hyphomonadaceae bacterium]|jgi:NitT/TauT family transport system permease protein|nr:ABC transporter permease [Hyphomonadaceae bacterium]
MAVTSKVAADRAESPGSASRSFNVGVWNVVSLAIALGIWQVGATLVASPFFPTPIKVVEAFIQLATRGDTTGHSLLAHAWASIERVLVGFGLGVLLGVPLGLLMGLYPKLYAGTRSVIEPFRFIPPIAWIPLAIIFFTGLTRFAFLIFLGAFFPIFTSTLVGVARVEPIHRKVGVVHGASKFWILRNVVVPTVMPDILAGMRVGLGTAWLTIVAAELAGGISTGLGRMMTNYAELLMVPHVIVGMLLIGLIGFLMNEVLLLIEKRLFRWRWQVSL